MGSNKVYIDEKKIQSRITELAKEIDTDYAGKEVTVIGVLNGSFIFMADLIRKMKTPIKIEFLAASSYGAGTESSGNVKIHLDLRKDIGNKHILLVEDIVDTGLTIKKVKELMNARGPASIKVCSFLYKPARIIHPIDIDYLAFEIEDHFVIGYGLDFDGRFRELPHLAIYGD